MVGLRFGKMEEAMFFPLSKRGELVSGETIKWILVILVIVAVGFAIRNIVSRAAG